MKQPSPLPWSNLDRWLNAMDCLLGDVPSIEINTMIVEEILPEIFIPWEVYQAIYPISSSYLIESNIHPSLRDRYLELRRRLELQYGLLLVDPQSKLYNPNLEAAVNQDLPVLAQSFTTYWESIPTRLPSPLKSDRAESSLFQLLQEPQFKATLQQLGQIKDSLDRKELSSQKILKQSTVYAQTLIQLDGKITNRYSQQILTIPERQSIVKLHHQGVLEGEKQWHQLLRFLFSIFTTNSTMNND